MAFFSFFFNFLMPVVGWSNIVLVFSVQPRFSDDMYGYIIAILFWILLSRKLLQKLPRAEFQVLNISSLWMDG